MVQSQIFRKENSTMKKDYMKPQGKIVAMQVNENIAISLDKPMTSMDYGVSYVVVGGTRYIQGVQEYPAANTGDDKADRFYDFLISYLKNLPSNCRFSPV